ncbi:hypothetical protein [Nodularia spumigena]|uniref:hypothetical protein n=1 Tax=Nodularia spumigena TaxID=70799 RepID=UPI002B202C16|nr:hypothetical protein [Nodularia spumigena]MEA5556405.1 hypothetical protein [Nodularia spumigena CH309]
MTEKVKASKTGKAKIREKYKQAGFTIASLAAEATTTEDIIKYLIGNETKKVKEVDRYVIENVVNAINAGLQKNGIDEKLKPSDIVDNWFPSVIPDEFKTVIADKTQIFCGRKFVFAKIQEFIENNTSGYFTILGDAGMGKSAIAAKYIVDNPGTSQYCSVKENGE